MVVIPIVGIQLRIGEIQTGKQLVFFKNEIGNHGLVRARPQVQGLQLLEPPHQKRKLRLKSRPPLPLVKRTQKRIRLRFHHPLRIQPIGQNPRQRALADSYGTFDGNVTGKFKKIGHELEVVLEKAGYLGSDSLAIARSVNSGSRNWGPRVSEAVHFLPSILATAQSLKGLIATILACSDPC